MKTFLSSSTILLVVLSNLWISNISAFHPTTPPSLLLTSFRSNNSDRDFLERQPSNFFVGTVSRTASSSSFTTISTNNRIRLFLSSNDDDASSSSSSSTPPLSAIEIQELKYLEMAQTAGPVEKPEIVYIIMYNPGTAREGVHTVEYPKGSEKDVLLAFESLDECVTFSNMLKADPTWPEEPIPSPTGLEQMEMACQQMGLPIQVVPAV